MKINFNQEQTELLREMDIPFDFSSDLTDDEILKIDELVSDYFSYNGINADDEVNQLGILCESIIDLISEL